MSEPTQTSNIPACITREPDHNGYVPSGTCGYHGKLYYPSFTLAAIFTAIASTILLGHLTRLIWHPKDGLQRYAVFISTCLVLGFIARTIGTKDQQNIYLAAVSDTVVLVSPILISILDCVVLRQIVERDESIVRLMGYKMRNVVRTLLFALVVLCGFQLLSSTMILTGNPSWLQVLGIHAYRVLIGIQGAILLCMLACTIDFHLFASTDVQKAETSTHPRSSRIHLAIYFSLIAVLLRILYRTVELSQVFDPNSTLPHKEVYFYACETTLTLCAIAVWVFAPVSQRESGKHQYQQVLEDGQQGMMQRHHGSSDSSVDEEQSKAAT